MARQLTIRVAAKAKLFDCEPDGSDCCACGDVPYLSAKRIMPVISMNGGPPLAVLSSAIYLCPACAESLEIGE